MTRPDSTRPDVFKHDPARPVGTVPIRAGGFQMFPKLATRDHFVLSNDYCCIDVVSCEQELY